MASKLLVLNAGSSSLKFKLFRVNEAKRVESAAAAGLIEQIGAPERSAITTQLLREGAVGAKHKEQVAVPNYTAALDLVLSFLKGAFSSNVVQHVKAVGHRVVHGKHISQPALLTPQVIHAIEDATDLAPLHNPPNLEGIRAAQNTFPHCPQVGVFDTAFHQTMPQSAYTYALPYQLAKERGIRRYGFHGISYYYLVQQAAAMLGKQPEQINLIACHLGAGSSVTCIRNGQSIDTSMGLTPLEGLCMATRSGDIDPAIVGYLMQYCGLSSIAEVDKMLNKQSGLQGIAGTADLREIAKRASQGDAQASLAMQVYAHRVRKYIGAYLVQLGGHVDAIVFSAGIGENSAFMRSMILADLHGLGVVLDDDANSSTVGGKQGAIHAEEATLKVLVIPTNEELSIAQQTLQTVAAMQTL